jgi:hypothetical protein
MRRFQEQVDGTIRNHPAVLGALLHGATEVNADQNSRQGVLVRCLREALVRTENRCRVVAPAAEGSDKLYALKPM